MITTFLQAVLDKRTTVLHYRSSYSPASSQARVQPLGLLWDRDRWYLVGRREGRAEEPRLWRADRVLSLKLSEHHANHDGAFNVERLLNRRWLHAAMAQWTQEVPVVIRLTRLQAARLQQDWYYQHARFENVSAAHALMTFGESNRELVFALLRWLGPEAELIEPRAWRAAMREELARMLTVYADSSASFDVGSAAAQDET